MEEPGCGAHNLQWFVSRKSWEAQTLAAIQRLGESLCLGYNVEGLQQKEAVWGAVDWHSSGP